MTPAQAPQLGLLGSPPDPVGRFPMWEGPSLTIVVTRLQSHPLEWPAYVLPRARPQVPPQNLHRDGGAGARGAGVDECLDHPAFAPCLSVHGYPWRGQNHGVTRVGQVAQLPRCGRHRWHHGRALWRLPSLYRHRCRSVRGLHRVGCGVQPWRRRSAVPVGASGLQASARPLQGLHDRRGTHAHQHRVQRDVENSGRAA